MDSCKYDMFRNRLTKVFRHTRRLARRQNVSCYRVYDHDLPEFPLCIEVYENCIYVAEYKRRHTLTDEEHEKWLSDCLLVSSQVLDVPIANIFTRRRQRKAGRTGQYQRISNDGGTLIARENELFFKVNLTDYLDTGLFLDHRLTRQLVRGEANDKRVLNLFCYTGSFSVYAAAGGADEVVSVDLSNTYLAWAQENFKLNKFSGSKQYRFVRADVKEYLATVPADHFDLVIMDPPTFSNSKMMKDFLDIQRDHVNLLNSALRGMKRGGTMYFSTNYRRFQLSADELHATEVKDITGATTPFDFQGKLSRYCFRITR